MEDKVTMELTRSEIFTLFNSLLVREPSPFVRQNKDWEELLKKLWAETTDKVKSEVLWHEGFRNLLEKWKVSYREDLERLNIPEVLEKDDY